MNKSESPSADVLRELVLKSGQGRFGGRRRLLIGGSVAVLALAVGIALFGSGGDEGPRYHTQQVRKGELVINVSATGNLQPTNSVDVGSELSGIIESVLVDRERPREEGAGDRPPRHFQAQGPGPSIEGRPGSRRGKGTPGPGDGGRNRGQPGPPARGWARLSGGKVPSKAELDSGEAAALRAVADQKAAEAAVASAKALLSTYEISLSKATILSPIDGIVLTRKVAPGQTVAAAMTAPVLFTLAEDLRRMELQVDVDEADVGKGEGGAGCALPRGCLAGAQLPGDGHSGRLGFPDQGPGGLLPDHPRCQERRVDVAPRA